MKLKSRGELNGFLDAGSHIQGELRFDDTFRVDGKLTGKAISQGNLVVGENGVIEADIEVGSIFVSGTVRGRVKATERIEIAAGGKVFAELETPRLVVEDGAILQGQCTMSRTRTMPDSEQPRAVVTPIAAQQDS